jgi:hypothetical protein
MPTANLVKHAALLLIHMSGGLPGVAVPLGTVEQAVGRSQNGPTHHHSNQQHQHQLADRQFLSCPWTLELVLFVV